MKPRTMMRRGVRNEKMLTMFHSWGILVNQTKRGYFWENSGSKMSVPCPTVCFHLNSLLPKYWVHTNRWFIKDEQFWTVYHGCCKGHPSLLPSTRIQTHNFSYTGFLHDYLVSELYPLFIIPNRITCFKKHRCFHHQVNLWFGVIDWNEYMPLQLLTSEWKQSQFIKCCRFLFRILNTESWNPEISETMSSFIFSDKFDITEQ